MKRRYVDLEVFESRNLSEGNIDYRYWLHKTNEERLHAAVKEYFSAGIAK